MADYGDSWSERVHGLCLPTHRFLLLQRPVQRPLWNSEIKEGVAIMAIFQSDASDGGRFLVEL